MNIFDQYLDKIIETIDALNQDHMIQLSEEGGIQDQLPKITNENEEIEIKDDIDNSRRKRRRSSASIE